MTLLKSWGTGFEADAFKQDPGCDMIHVIWIHELYSFLQICEKYRKMEGT